MLYFILCWVICKLVSFNISDEGIFFSTLKVMTLSCVSESPKELGNMLFQLHAPPPGGRIGDLLLSCLQGWWEPLPKSLGWMWLPTSYRLVPTAFCKIYWYVGVWLFNFLVSKGQILKHPIPLPHLSLFMTCPHTSHPKPDLAHGPTSVCVQHPSRLLVLGTVLLI